MAIQQLRSLVCSHEGPRAFPGTSGLPSSFRFQGVDEKKMLKSPKRRLEDGISYPKGKWKLCCRSLRQKLWRLFMGFKNLNLTLHSLNMEKNSWGIFRFCIMWPDMGDLNLPCSHLRNIVHPLPELHFQKWVRNPNLCGFQWNLSLCESKLLLSLDLGSQMTEELKNIPQSIYKTCLALIMCDLKLQFQSFLFSLMFY